MNKLFKQSVLVVALAQGLMLSPVVSAQQKKSAQPTMEEILVSARRRQEKLQDVPISMTVLTQDQMKNANITNSGDIALYTPSLTVNSRFGEDNTSFAIRGFTQELRTTASVGVYFADVVSPRGSNSQVSGDGAGPGMMFDLENVQVLKGPQGTLFGRNTTGGAVLLVPKKPTDALEGYVEVTAGNYSLRQEQGVLNLPINDKNRLRLGIDTKKRDGFLNNVSGIGPKDFSDVDYTSGRISLVTDITDSLENYLILTYSSSNTNGSFTKATACNTSAMGGGVFNGFVGDMCQAQLDRMAAEGHTDFWDISQNMPHPRSEIKDWRIINTTTWDFSDDLTVKNIISYAELNTVSNSPIWATNYRFVPFLATDTYIPFKFATSGARGDGHDITDSYTMVEELQFQGKALEDRLQWQGGLYYETTKPKKTVGQSSASLIACDFKSLESGNPNDWRCNDVLAGATILGMIQGGTLPPAYYGNEAAYLGAPVRVGSISVTSDRVEYTNQAVYAQGTYDINEQLSFTAGLRYTYDVTDGAQDRVVYHFPYDPLTGSLMPYDDAFNSPRKHEVERSHAPTWLLGLDYKPTDSDLLYAKYSRGYRQGSVNVSSQPGLLVFGPEKVDTYEVGYKTSFSNAISGYFNSALFYNDFRDQQLQNGLLLSPEYGGVGSTAIVNAGKSTIWGFEMDTGLNLFEGFTLSVSYSYLNTEVKEIKDVNAFIAASGATPATLSAVVGDQLPFAPENSVVASAKYRLPLSAELGDVDVGATYVFTDKMRMSSSAQYSPLAVLPSYEVVNFNVSWRSVVGSPFDLSLFVNNVFDKEYYTYATGNFATLENETALPGHPRMYGLRLRYNFGAEQ